MKDDERLLKHLKIKITLRQLTDTIRKKKKKSFEIQKC